MFEPHDFMAGLAALVPNPRVNVTRFHSVCAPNHLTPRGDACARTARNTPRKFTWVIIYAVNSDDLTSVTPAGQTSYEAIYPSK